MGIEGISKHLHYLHIMCYDYHGSWDAQTGHNAPLRLPNGTSLIPELRLSVEDTIKYYIDHGAPRNKIVMGIPFYGRTFTLQDFNLQDKGAPTKGQGFKGPYTREDGFYGYNEICTELKMTSDEVWTEVWDKNASVPYIFNGNRWISYDDHRRVAIKVRLAYEEGLAGAMVWAIDNDDFGAECSSVRYPLLRTINSEFKMALMFLVVPLLLILQQRPVSAPFHVTCSSPALLFSNSCFISFKILLTFSIRVLL